MKKKMTLCRRCPNQTLTKNLPLCKICYNHKNNVTKYSYIINSKVIPDRDQLGYQASGVLFASITEGNIWYLLLQEKRNGIIKMNPPGGTREKYDNGPIITAHRELEEELSPFDINYLDFLNDETKVLTLWYYPGLYVLYIIFIDPEKITKLNYTKINDKEPTLFGLNWVNSKFINSENTFHFVISALKILEKEL